jgi:hypothetical protein
LGRNAPHIETKIAHILRQPTRSHREALPPYPINPRPALKTCGALLLQFARTTGHKKTATGDNPTFRSRGDFSLSETVPGAPGGKRKAEIAASALFFLECKIPVKFFLQFQFCLRFACDNSISQGERTQKHIPCRTDRSNTMKV